MLFLYFLLCCWIYSGSIRLWDIYDIWSIAAAHLQNEEVVSRYCSEMPEYCVREYRNRNYHIVQEAMYEVVQYELCRLKNYPVRPLTFEQPRAIQNLFEFDPAKGLSIFDIIYDLIIVLKNDVIALWWFIKTFL